MIARLFAALFFLLSLYACKPHTETASKPTVLVSIPPYAYFIKKIAGSSVHVETLIPAGANPHVYESSPREVQRHQTAKLWFSLGESSEKKISQYFKDTHQPVQIIDLTQDIELLADCHEEHCSHIHGEGHDLHLWLSPKIAKKQAQMIASALMKLLPEQQDTFGKNLQVFLEELENLDQQIAHTLESLSGKAILVSHPAFSYFCRDYHLIQLSIEVEGKDPLPQHITRILKKAKHYSVQGVLTEPQYSNKGAELIAHSLHLPTHMVDPYAENYTENLIHIAKVIAK